jgi:hypothetical protein
VVFVAGRAQAEGIAHRLRTGAADTPADSLDGFDLGDYQPDYEPMDEPADDATSPLASEADYGWPLEEPEMARTESL